MTLQDLVDRWHRLSQGLYTIMDADEAMETCADELQAWIVENNREK